MCCAAGNYFTSNVDFGLNLLGFSPMASLPVPLATNGFATQHWAMPLNKGPGLFDNFISLCSAAKGENASQSLQTAGVDYFVDTRMGRAEAMLIAPGRVGFRIGDVGGNEAASMEIDLRRDRKSESLLAVLTYRSRDPLFSIQQSTYLPVDMWDDAPPSSSSREGVGTTIITSGAVFLREVAGHLKRVEGGLWRYLSEKLEDEIPPSAIFNIADLFSVSSPWEFGFYFWKGDDATVDMQRDNDGLIVPPKGFEEDGFRNEELHVDVISPGLAAYDEPDSNGTIKTTEDMPRIMISYSPREEAPYFQPGWKFEGEERPTVQIIQNARVFWWGAEPFAKAVTRMLASAAALYGLPYYELDSPL